MRNNFFKLLLLFQFVALCQCKSTKTPQIHTYPPPSDQTTELNEKPKATPPSLKPEPLAVEESVALQKEFLAIVNAWNEMPSQFTGRELIAKQQELAYQAVGKLAGGAELTQFLEFLKNKGAVDLHNEIVERGMMDAFRAKGEAMRNWVLSVKDLKMKEQLMLQAGEAYDGADLKAYFERVGNSPNGHNCQCRLMTGYCSKMAEKDPMAAIKVYGEYCHPKKINNTGLAKVMEHLQPNADFPGIAAATAPDSAGISKNTRRSLLANWSQHKPVDAAQYVMSNTSVVHADQMAVVMSVWAQKSPDAAAKWLEEWDASAHKDHGSLALMQNWLKQNKPAQAFQMAVGIGDFELRVKAATEAFSQWAVVDKKAAEAAWVKAFPQ